MLQKNMRTKETKFSLERFVSPGVEYSPVYCWNWNAPVTKEETDRQLDEFSRLGIKAFYIIPEPKSFRPASIPTMLEPDYLTAPYFEAYKYALESAFRRGFVAWIYNEAGWPSGGACGKVLLKNPHLARRCLRSREVKLSAGEAYNMSSDAVAAFVFGNRMIESGYVPKEDITAVEYYSHRMFFERPGIPDFPDLTRSESTDAFIESTHEGYKAYLEEYFGNGIQAVFTDEPTAPRPTPFYPELMEEYERRFGESIIPYLPAVLKNVVPNEKEALARIRWFDMCSEIFCKNYLLREKEWCNKNGLEYIGHMDIDNIPNGSIVGGNFNLMRALRCFDSPGIDVIWRQIFPGEPIVFDDDWNNRNCDNKFFPRYASSAAAQIGADTVISETFAVYGNGLTFDQMRYVIGFQAIRGINVFNPAIISYGREGFLLAGLGPQFSENYACYRDLKYFNEYTERLCYVLSLGERCVNVALYLPIRDMAAGICEDEISDKFDRTGFELEKAGIYFDIVDDDVFLECDKHSLSLGKISMGNASYDTIIIPSGSFISDEAKVILSSFANVGGKLYTIGELGIEGAVCVKDCKELLTPSLSYTYTRGEPRLFERKVENGRIVAIFNEDIKNKCEISVFAGDENVYILDLTNGVLKRADRKGEVVSLSLEIGETVVLFFSDDVLSVHESKDYNNIITLNGNLTFKRTNQLIIGDMRAESVDIIEDEKEVIFGDWRQFVGEEFSGSGIYKMTFFAPDDIRGRAMIDLGKVCYSAEVTLNGVSLGTKIMPPYTFEFNAEILKNENVLCIRVANSVANAFTYTASFDKWASWQLSPFSEKQRAFDKESFSGGLIGPLTLKF